MEVVHSEELDEIISNQPHWFIRLGTGLFLVLLAGLIVLAGLVKYPVMVRCSFALTSSNAPQPVVSKTDTRLSTLLVHDRQVVGKQQVLAYLENSADNAHVLELAAYLDSLHRLGPANSGRLRERVYFPEKLGELQANYQTFAQAYSQYHSQHSQLFYRQKQAMLRAELQNLQRIGQNLAQQNKLYASDLALTHSEVQAQRTLARQGVIASSDFRREESKELAKQFPLKQVEAAVLANVAAQQAKAEQLLELEKQLNDQANAYVQALNTLRSTLDAWKSRYVLRAPVAGRVRFSRFVEPGQVLRTNEEVFYMEAAPAAYYGAMSVPQQNLGKVQVGQQVLIRLDGYPFSEYGMLEGRVAALSAIPGADNTFMAKVTLPNGLVTSYGRRITYRHRISAQADIVTEDISLLARIFFRLRSIWSSPATN